MTELSLRVDRQLCFALYATSRAVIQAYAPLLAPLGVTYPQYLVLLVLWEEDRLTVGEIGARLFLDSGTLTPLLKRLETRGLVARRRDASDERRVRVGLTAAGKASRSNAEPILAGMTCAIGERPAAIASLRHTLQRMLLHLQSPRPPVPAKPRAPRTTRTPRTPRTK